MSNSDPLDDLARSEGRAGFAQVLLEDELRRLAGPPAGWRRPLALRRLLAWSVAGGGIVAAVAAGAAELIG